MTTLDKVLFMVCATLCGLAVLFGVAVAFGLLEGDKTLIVGAILGPLVTMAGIIVGVYGIGNRNGNGKANGNGAK